MSSKDGEKSSGKEAEEGENEEGHTAGIALSDFVQQLEDYTPTVRSLYFFLQAFLRAFCLFSIKNSLNVLGWSSKGGELEEVSTNKRSKH